MADADWPHLEGDKMLRINYFLCFFLNTLLLNSAVDCTAQQTMQQQQETRPGATSWKQIPRGVGGFAISMHNGHEVDRYQNLIFSYMNGFFVAEFRIIQQRVSAPTVPASNQSV